MRLLQAALVAAVVVTACGLFACVSAPPSHTQSKKDETKDPWYAETTDKLASQNREAERLWKSGREDDAAKLIQSGELLADKLLAVRNPTLTAMQGASDVDDVYGRMLLANHNYGWARLFFQKNAARWKIWQPRTEDTAARLKEAVRQIDECDRKMGQ